MIATTSPVCASNNAVNNTMLLLHSRPSGVHQQNSSRQLTCKSTLCQPTRLWAVNAGVLDKWRGAQGPSPCNCASSMLFATSSLSSCVLLHARVRAWGPSMLGFLTSGETLRDPLRVTVLHLCYLQHLLFLPVCCYLCASARVCVC